MSDASLNPSQTLPQLQPRLDLDRLNRTARHLTLALVLGLTAALLLPIDGAVIAPGRVLVEGRAQPVKSLDPGIVTHVAVRNGDQVMAGQVLLELDSATARAKLDIARSQLILVQAETARLEAEASSADSIEFAFALPDLPLPVADTQPAMARQQALFESRRAQKLEAESRLAETLAQLEAQKAGTAAQQAATRDEAGFLAAEITRQTALMDRGLGRQAPLGDLHRQQAALVGRIAQLDAELIRLDGALREARSTHAAESARRREEIATGLRDRTQDAQQMLSDIVALHVALLRSELRAPVAGVIHDLNVPAAGSVIAGGAQLAQILPDDRALEIEAEIAPGDIDKLVHGQRAEVMLTAFDMRNTARLPAKVIHLPPDAVRDDYRPQHFYRVRLALDDDSLPDGLTLRAGMEAQVFLTTGQRSLLDWLTAPIRLPIARALRED